jgi:glucosamine--fructose-6-phosphate aminotransferase (isomerizing)
MCGIVGYVGSRFAAPILLDGLKRLEYRGYDSAGIAVLTPEGRIRIDKREGKLAELVGYFNGDLPAGYLGIGHTRWATHGAPTTRNAHPHTDCDEEVVVVHNGIIENYAALRDGLLAQGHVFRSETDTEVVAHLIEAAYDSTGRTEGDFIAAVCHTARQLKGAYAIVAFARDHPQLIVGARLFSPLVAGIGRGENYVASDIPAILRETQYALLVEDAEVVAVRPGGVSIFDLDGHPIDRAPFHVTWDARAAEKGGYPHFVLKEIYEQPEALRAALRGRLTADDRVALPELDTLDMDEVDRVYIVACGTSFYAGLVGKLALEAWARVPVEVVVASEFRYGRPVLDEQSLIILITQSGETADTLAGFRLAEKAGAPTIAVTNVMASSITRGTDAVLYLQVGPEVGVVATKTFTAQLVLLYLLALKVAARRGLAEGRITEAVRGLRQLPAQVERALELDEQTAELAQVYRSRRSMFFFGRGYSYPVALEGALKLKEISYIHAEGYPAGELKHGPIAMLDPTIPVIAVATQSQTYSKVVGNIQEVRARDAEVVVLATEGDAAIRQHADHIIYVPRVDEALSPIVNVVPLQLFAYHMAVARGCDVDQPRNLAKSVTVE